MPNHITPGFLLLDSMFAALRVQTREFFLRLIPTVDDHHRLAIGRSPEFPDVLRSLVYPANPEVRIPDVACYLQELKVAGAVLVADSERGWYLEVVERLRYRREDYAEGQPKYGPRFARVATQGELPMTVPLAVPRARKVGRGKVGDSSGSKAESETKAITNQGDSGIRVLSQGEDSEPVEKKRERGVFAAGEWSRPGDDAWLDLVRFLNAGEFSSKEMWDNGKRWVQWFESDRAAVVDGVLQGLTLEKEGHVFVNRGAWLTEQIEQSSRKRSA